MIAIKFIFLWVMVAACLFVAFIFMPPWLTLATYCIYDGTPYQTIAMILYYVFLFLLALPLTLMFIKWGVQNDR